MTLDQNNIHASCVSLNGRGLLIRGASGSGKSQLALSLINDAGAQLVADDRVVLQREGTWLSAQAPARLKGLIERYGMGIETHEFIDIAMLCLVIDLVARDQIERMPEPEELFWSSFGVTLPKLVLPAQPLNALSSIRAVLARIEQK